MLSAGDLAEKQRNGFGAVGAFVEGGEHCAQEEDKAIVLHISRG